MKYRISQMPSSINYFRDFDELGKFDIRNYVNTWVDDIDMEKDSDVLNELFEIFNIRRPKNFAGHSLCVGDLITLDESRIYYVEAFGFARLAVDDSGRYYKRK